MRHTLLLVAASTLAVAAPLGQVELRFGGGEGGCLSEPVLRARLKERALLAEGEGARFRLTVVEGAGRVRVQLDRRDGTRVAERVLPSGPDACAALAEGVCVLAQAWLEWRPVVLQSPSGEPPREQERVQVPAPSAEPQRRLQQEGARPASVGAGVPAPSAEPQRRLQQEGARTARARAEEPALSALRQQRVARARAEEPVPSVESARTLRPQERAASSRADAATPTRRLQQEGEGVAGVRAEAAVPSAEPSRGLQQSNEPERGGEGPPPRVSAPAPAQVESSVAAREGRLSVDLGAAASWPVNGEVGYAVALRADYALHPRLAVGAGALLASPVPSSLPGSATASVRAYSFTASVRAIAFQVGSGGLQLSARAGIDCIFAETSGLAKDAEVTLYRPSFGAAVEWRQALPWGLFASFGASGAARTQELAFVPEGLKPPDGVTLSPFTLALGASLGWSVL